MYLPSFRDWEILESLRKSDNNLYHYISRKYDNGEFFQLGGGNYQGFSEPYTAGWKNWDENGLGNQLMTFSAVAIGVPLVLSNPVTVAVAGAESETLKVRGLRFVYEVTSELAMSGGWKEANLVGIAASAISGSPVVELFAAKYEYSIKSGAESLSNERAILNIGIGRAAGNFIPSETLIENFSKTYHVGLLHFTAFTGQSLIKGVSPTPNKKGWESPF